MYIQNIFENCIFYSIKIGFSAEPSPESSRGKPLAASGITNYYKSAPNCTVKIFINLFLDEKWWRCIWFTNPGDSFYTLSFFLEFSSTISQAWRTTFILQNPQWRISQSFQNAFVRMCMFWDWFLHYFFQCSQLWCIIWCATWFLFICTQELNPIQSCQALKVAVVPKMAAAASLGCLGSSW